MPSATATSGEITLTCDIARVEDSIVFTYSLANQGRTAVVVMDAAPVVDLGTGKRSADAASVTTWLGADNHAHVLKGTAPLPDGIEPEAAITPLGVRLEPGKTIERRISERLPLSEHSPYAPPGNLRDYRMAAILGVALTVEVLPALPGLIAEARDIARGLWRVSDPEVAAGLVQRLTCAFPARGLFMLARLEGYKRPEPAPPAAPTPPAPDSSPGGSAV